MAVKLFYPPGGPNTGNEEQNYSMWIVPPNVQAFHCQINHHPNRSARCAWRYRHKPRATRGRDTDRDPVRHSARTFSLRDFHWSDGLLQAVSLWWVRDTFRLPSSQGL